MDVDGWFVLCECECICDVCVDQQCVGEVGVLCECDCVDVVVVCVVLGYYFFE